MTKKTIKLQYLVFYFCIYSFIGWLLETCYGLIVLGHFTKRGFLYSPVCPIYGWGAVILILFLDKYKKNSLKLFLYSSIVFSILEYIAGFALDALFAERWWDYTNDFMNLNGRISIFYSIAWGIVSILFINHIHPFIEKHFKRTLKRISLPIRTILIKIIPIVYTIDTIFSSLKHLNII